MIRRNWSGEAAKAARLAAEMRPDAVADVLGVDRSSVYGWEQGREPQMRHVLALAELYGVAIDSLFVHADHDGDGTADADALAASDGDSPANADTPAAITAGAVNTGGHEGALTQE
jgi:transcriptional regulator with XRE-family HTH domain